MYKTLSEEERLVKSKDQAPSFRGLPFQVQDIQTPTILICSHGQRDSRCGILGPLLHEEFRRHIDGQLHQIPDGTRVRLKAQTGIFQSDLDPGPSATADTSLASSAAKTLPVNIGMISHVGGHKWAGNVIVYTPSLLSNSLSGTGIWYGRVEPKHVPGIVQETLLKGRVIQDLYRGGINSNGDVLRI
jgi:(2Fe-2S) ferredoxin